MKPLFFLLEIKTKGNAIFKSMTSKIRIKFSCVEQDDFHLMATSLSWHVQKDILGYTSKKDRENFAQAFPWWRWLVTSYTNKLPEHTPEEMVSESTISKV